MKIEKIEFNFNIDKGSEGKEYECGCFYISDLKGENVIGTIGEGNLKATLSDGSILESKLVIDPQESKDNPEELYHGLLLSNDDDTAEEIFDEKIENFYDIYYKIMDSIVDGIESQLRENINRDTIEGVITDFNFEK